MDPLQRLRLRLGRIHSVQGRESRLLQAALDRPQPFGGFGMAGTHLMKEPAFMCDEEGFQCCDAIQAGDATPVNARIFGLPRPSVHEKEMVKLKRAPVSVAPAQQ